MLDTAGGSTSAPAGDVAIPASPAPNIVHLPCRCPGLPHPYDVVTLREHVTLPMGMAVGAVTRYPTNQATMEAALGLIYLGFGIESWTFADRNDKGEHVPVWITEPVERELLERWLPFASGGLIVAEACDRLYSEDVFRPFRERSRTRSPSGPAATSTSATTASGPTPLRPWKPSSRKPSGGKRSAR